MGLAVPVLSADPAGLSSVPSRRSAMGSPMGRAGWSAKARQLACEGSGASWQQSRVYESAVHTASAVYDVHVAGHRAQTDENMGQLSHPVLSQGLSSGAHTHGAQAGGAQAGRAQALAAAVAACRLQVNSHAPDFEPEAKRPHLSPTSDSRAVSLQHQSQEMHSNRWFIKLTKSLPRCQE